MDIDACFDSLLCLEDSFADEGRGEGIIHGERVGFEDGRLLGLERGFDLGEELGTIYGSAIFWSGLLSRSPERYSKRYFFKWNGFRWFWIVI